MMLFENLSSRDLRKLAIDLDLVTVCSVSLLICFAEKNGTSKRFLSCNSLSYTAAIQLSWIATLTPYLIEGALHALLSLFWVFHLLLFYDSICELLHVQKLAFKVKMVISVVQLVYLNPLTNKQELSAYIYNYFIRRSLCNFQSSLLKWVFFLMLKPCFFAVQYHRIMYSVLFCLVSKPCSVWTGGRAKVIQAGHYIKWYLPVFLRSSGWGVLLFLLAGCHRDVQFDAQPQRCICWGFMDRFALLQYLSCFNICYMLIETVIAVRHFELPEQCLFKKIIFRHYVD